MGKTTIAREVASRVTGTVVVSGDALRGFAPDDAKQYLGSGSTYRAAAALVREYLEMGAPLVIVDYVFSRRSHVDALVALGASPPVVVSVFTLWARLDVVMHRESQRAGRERMGERVEEVWSELWAHRDELGAFIDTSDSTIPEVARRVIDGAR